MTSIAPIQRFNVVKSFFAVFLISTAAWAVVSILLLGGLYLSWLTFLAGLALALTVGWGYYRRKYHATLRYDVRGFELQWGPHRVAGQWQDFAQVSLVLMSDGGFGVRLYRRGGSDFVEIPASTLKLEPSDFRFTVIDLVKQAGAEHGR